MDDASGPEIMTARLLLRPHRVADHAARCAMTADPETMRFIGGQPQSAEENWARILRYAGHWRLFGFGLFAVVERATDDFVGEVGLMHFGRGLGPDFDPAPEAAWVMTRGAAGWGYATEALVAAFAWTEAVRPIPREVCIIAPDNAPSLRLAARLGFAPFGKAAYHDRPVILHERRPPLPNAAPSR
jgi:RimJ/RimL family protein N-acetyltransferase